MTSVLEKYEAKILKNLEKEQAQIEKIDMELAQIYTRSKRKPYLIHGIIMHEGEASSGHFYSYIKDHANEMWFKFSDHRVTEVESEEEVMEEAFGSAKPKTSAYLIVYASEKMVASTVSLEEHYSEYIDDAMEKEIEKSNMISCNR